MPVEIFFSYAHKDEPLLRKLKSHLKPLQRQGLIDTWHDRDINAGTNWEQEIDKHLNSAQIILLLVSPDFMNSDYCYSIEMKRALERDERGEARVIPIILRRIHWQGAPFGKHQALPTGAKPVVGSRRNSDEAFFEVADGIHKAVEELIRRPTFSSPSKPTSVPTDLISQTPLTDSKIQYESEPIIDEGQLEQELNAASLKGTDRQQAVQLCYSILNACKYVLFTFRSLGNNYPYDQVPPIRVLLFLVYPHFKCMALQLYVTDIAYVVNCKHRFTLDPSKQANLSLTAQAWNSQQISHFSYQYEYAENLTEYLRESLNFGFDRTKVAHIVMHTASAVAFPFLKCKFNLSGTALPIVICIDSERKNVFPQQTFPILSEIITDLINDLNTGRQRPLELNQEDYVSNRWYSEQKKKGENEEGIS